MSGKIVFVLFVMGCLSLAFGMVVYTKDDFKRGSCFNSFSKYENLTYLIDCDFRDENLRNVLCHSPQNLTEYKISVYIKNNNKIYVKELRQEFFMVESSSELYSIEKDLISSYTAFTLGMMLFIIAVLFNRYFN